MTWVACPSGRVGYPDRPTAQRSMTAIQKRMRRGHRAPMPVELYRCPDCGLWHLSCTPTRSPKRRFR